MIAALAPLQQEEKLKVLDSLDAVYVLVSPEAPYVVLWASTKFPQVCACCDNDIRLPITVSMVQLTGYFLSDILCRDMSFLSGTRTDRCRKL